MRGVNLLGLLAALVVATAFSADSLGAGSAMALLVAGVGTNVSTLGPVARVMGRRTTVLYAMNVVALTGLVGLVLNRPG